MTIGTADGSGIGHAAGPDPQRWSRAFPGPTARYGIVVEAAAGVGADAVVARLRHAFADHAPPLVILPAGHEVLRWRFVDTFDGRIHRAGGTMAVVARAGRRAASSAGADGENGPWLLWQAHDGQLVDGVAWAGPPPAFARDVTAAGHGAFGDRLAAPIAPRRLLPLVGATCRTARFHVVDGEGKTVVRVGVLDGTTSNGGARIAIAPWLELFAVRGYDQAHAMATAACDRLVDEGALIDGSPGLAVRALAALGRKAGGVSTKFDVPLEPDMPAPIAAAAIFKALRKTIRATLPGTKADLDPEFLHDFRVAVRRTRAGLTLLRDALPAPVVAHFKIEFGWLGGATGPTRDMDVYLDGMAAYRAALPPDVAADLGPLEAYLHTRQAAAHDELAAALDTPRFTALLTDWKAALSALKSTGRGATPSGGAAEAVVVDAVALVDAADASEVAAPPAATTPIAALAARQTWRRYRRVLADGRAIDAATPVASLHALRIEAKKLRYALEFFRRLVPIEAADALIGSLKGLQDNLGTLNDLGVQQGAMRAFAADLARRPTNSATLLAMGWLTAELHRREQECRREFGDRFRAFDAKDNRQRYERLFHGVGGQGGTVGAVGTLGDEVAADDIAIDHRATADAAASDGNGSAPANGGGR